MQNQNDDDSDFSDEVYDETLDDNFEDELEDDEYLDEEELAAYADLEDEDGEWEESDEDQEEDFVEENLGASVRKKKILNIDMSFNAMVITGAIIVGIGVLAFQVVTKKPIISIDAFTSALRMSGASDGPVFGEDESKDNSSETVLAEGSHKEETKGFLYDPDILNSMEMELEGTPPMPSPIASEDKQGDNSSDIVDTSLTSLPEKQKIDDSNQVPRPPEDAPVADKGLFDLIDKKEPEKTTAKKLLKAEEFLKAAVEARTEKTQVTGKPSKEKPKENLSVENKILEKVESVPKSKPEPVKQVQEVEQVRVENLKATQFSSGAEQKLNMILERLDDMELQITQIREAGNSKIEDISDNLDSLKKEMGSISSASVQKSASVVSKVTSKKVAPKKSTAMKAKSRPKKRATPAKVSWELRAAQPGKAWVSKKGHKDMRPVVVGDTLSSIGRITAISYSGNRWVVQGTSGRILQ